MMLDQYRPMIEAALAHTGGACTWEQVCDEIESGRAFLMVSPTGKSVAVLQPVHVLHIFTAGGDMAELMDMEAEATERAKAAHFDSMALVGRDGWKRQLRSRGWREQPAMAMVKDL